MVGVWLSDPFILVLGYLGRDGEFEGRSKYSSAHGQNLV